MVTSALSQDLRKIEGARLWAKAPLAPFTTIGTGGKADLLVSVNTTQALQRTLAALERADTPWLCLGAGSNLLVADQGYRGVLIKLDEGFHYVDGLPEPGQLEPGVERIIAVGGGAYLARLAAVVAEAGLSGLEFACGIPGSVGGGVAMNAGAHGGSMKDVVEAVELVSAEGAMWVSGESLSWEYRHCDIPRASMVSAVRLRLCGGDAGAIQEYQRTLLRTRRKSQPRGLRTFGSVFKNPPGDSAGRLLDAAGVKGVHRGGAEVSSIHANFVVNLGDATTADVLTLMSHMRQGVHRMNGILLEPEVRLLGCSFPWDGASAEASPEVTRQNG